MNIKDYTMDDLVNELVRRSLDGDAPKMLTFIETVHGWLVCNNVTDEDDNMELLRVLKKTIQESCDIDIVEDVTLTSSQALIDELKARYSAIDKSMLIAHSDKNGIRVQQNVLPKHVDSFLFAIGDSLSKNQPT